MQETGWRFEGASYPTIQELIERQHASGQPVTNRSQAILKKAVLREDWELLNDHIHLEMKIGNVSNMRLGVYSCGKWGGWVVNDRIHLEMKIGNVSNMRLGAVSYTHLTLPTMAVV